MKNLVLAVILFFHLLVLAAQKTKDEQIRDLLPFEEIGHSIASATAEQIPFFHSYPGLTDRQLEDIIRHFIDSGKQDFIDSLSNIFDRLFTPEEIQQLQESFNSPAGEKYRSLLPLITGKSIRAIYSWYLSNQDHISNMIDSIYNETGYQIREDFTYTEIEFKKGKPYRFRKKPGSKSVYQNPANRFRIYYDSKIWNEIDPEALNPSADIAFKLNESEVYAMVISEQDDLNLKELRYAAVHNLYKVSGRYELIRDELRKVNGTEMLFMQFKALINSVDIIYHNYYYTNHDLVIQFSTFTGTGTFEGVSKKMEDLLNGLVIIQKREK